MRVKLAPEDQMTIEEFLAFTDTRPEEYASVPNCQHYVTVAQDKVEVWRYDRADGWKGTTLDRLTDRLELAALGADVAIPLAEIYRWTPLAPST